MNRIWVALLCWQALLCGCASAPEPVTSMSLDELLSGRALFGESVTSSEAPLADILKLDDSMRVFLRDSVADAPQAGTRMRRLIDAMIDQGLLTLDYDPNLTYTAQETFHRRQGNCLSFTNLFMALARQVDLRVSYQMVDIPPTWLSEGEFVILNNHINVVVENIRVHGRFKRDYVVDFNTAEFNGNYDTVVVGDDYARALYYSNVAVEAMQSGTRRLAFAYLLRGIEANAEVPGLWVNLGSLYSRAGRLDGAEAAYLHALEIQPGNKSALTNLAGLHKRLGNAEASAYYAGRVRYYRNQNPYYYYWRASVAYREQRYDDALVSLHRAIRLKDDEHQFYYLRGLTQLRTGNRDAARQSLQEAAEYASQDRVERAYNQKLEALRGG